MTHSDSGSGLLRLTCPEVIAPDLEHQAAHAQLAYRSAAFVERLDAMARDLLRLVSRLSLELCTTRQKRPTNAQHQRVHGDRV
jgi:hypothetical protein